MVKPLIQNEDLSQRSFEDLEQLIKDITWESQISDAYNTWEKCDRQLDLLKEELNKRNE